MRADSDEMDLSLDTISRDPNFWDLYMRQDSALMAPCSTPVPDVTSDHILISEFQRHRTHTKDLIDQGKQTEKDCIKCVFCENPEIDPFRIPPSKFRVIAPNIYPEKSGGKKHKSNTGVRKKRGGKRTEILVEVPQVSYIPELTVDSPKSPKSQNNHVFGEEDKVPDHKRQGRLIKTFRQNELRHREVSNLLEDVHEINEMNRTLKEVSGL